MVTPRSDIRIGVTGHRRLGGRDAEVAATVGALLDEILGHFLPPEGTVPITILSALAEGADRVAAHAALQRGAALDVVLPLEPGDYRTDFDTPGSLEEFDQLLDRATKVAVVDPQPTRDDAYYEAGAQTLAGSDILLAIWDGNDAAGRGGTAEIVELARQQGKPVAWIHVDQDPHEGPSSDLIVTRERWPWPS